MIGHPRLMARNIVSAIYEQLPQLESLGKSLKSPKLSDSETKRRLQEGDISIFLRGLYTNNERKFARKWRNIFAHDRITYRDDGSITIMDRQGTTVCDLSLPELVQLGAKIQGFDLNNRVKHAIRSVVTCNECGVQIEGAELLPCGHGKYENLDITEPALFRKPSNGTLLIEYQMSDASTTARKRREIKL